MAPRTLSITPNRARTALFRPDLMFSGPFFNCSGSPNQAWKPPEAPGSLKSNLEAFKMPLEASLAWPGLGLAWPGLALPWLGLAWPGLALAWPALALAWPGLAWPIFSPL